MCGWDGCEDGVCGWGCVGVAVELWNCGTGRFWEGVRWESDGIMTVIMLMMGMVAIMMEFFCCEEGI